MILIRVQAEAAEYWKSGNLAEKVTYLFKRLTKQDTEQSNLNETIDLK